MLRVVSSLLEMVAGASREPETRSPMPEVTSQFELRQLLKAVAVYAAGGLAALKKSAAPPRLIEQLR